MHKSRFEVLGGAKSKAVPQVPAAFVHRDQFAAYPDGRVFVVAAARTSNAMEPGPALLLDFGPSGVGVPTYLHLRRADLSKAFVKPLAHDRLLLES